MRFRNSWLGLWSRQNDAYSVSKMENLFTIETIQSEALRAFIAKKQKANKNVDQEMVFGGR